jgi:hypothetical protein
MPLKPASPGLQILKTVLYLLAALILVLGLIAGFSLAASADHVAANVMLPFQLLGGSPIADLFSSMLSRFLINLGIVVMVLSVLLSALLYGVGRLIQHVTHLEARLARLETGLEPGEGPA